VNILIVKLSALGDVTHTLPALTALRRAHPSARIAWLVEAAAAPLVTGHPALNEVLIWPRREFTRALRSGHWAGAWRVLRAFLRDLRAVRYDVVLDFQGLLKSAVWVALARGDRKVGWGRGMARSEGSYLFLNERVPAVSMEVHALERGLLLLEAIGIPRGPVVYDLPITVEARTRAEQLLQTGGIGARDRFVALHPMTRWPTKQWSSERFAAVADAVRAQGFPAVFTGATEDRAGVDAVFACLKGPALRLDGRLDLKTLAAVFERAAVVVSTDTGPMHMAAAVGTPVVAVFGPTAPNRTGPYGCTHRVVRAGVACSPCFSRTCRSSVGEPMACMKRLETVDVIRAVIQTLQGQGSASPAAPVPAGREVRAR
jgi:lipopolysaccharide heptosyltransferase I